VVLPSQLIAGGAHGHSDLSILYPFTNGLLVKVADVDGFTYHMTSEVGSVFNMGKIRVSVPIVLDLKTDMFDSNIDLSLGFIKYAHVLFHTFKLKESGQMSNIIFNVSG
jgi:hypothetical protein